MTLEKNYDAAATEAKHYEAWEKSGAFACDPNSAKTPFTIMIPPPNVTGSLHMGHALTFTLQDVLIRHARMTGRDALWQPGTDHAGIATQMVVERQLAAQKTSRQELGRDKFLDKVWEWKAESGGTITQQLRRLGASPDWARERFTMDPGLNKAVNKVFVELYKKGLIYKDKRLVNWDPKMLTAISDLEVEQKEVRGNLWHLRYPVEGTDETITVATTRPETMLGDTAVAVHPDDERYKHLVGKHVVLPLTGRRIPIIADEYADPEKGSGAVKITPAHDYNDYEVWKRHREQDIFKQQPNGGLINIFDKHAHIVQSPENDEAFKNRPTEDGKLKSFSIKHYNYAIESIPKKYRGLERFAARKQILVDLEEQGVLEKIEPQTHQVPHGDRSGVVIEPWLSEQWYVNAEVLAKPALEAVETGKMEFVPKQWENTYFAWLRDIKPWCISRQLWWGHQIPAWYGPENPKTYGTKPPFSQEAFVAEIAEDALAAAKAFYTGIQVGIAKDRAEYEAWLKSYVHGSDQPIKIYRDEDVLDTWFSSALWPFSTLGWPDKTPELARYYPTDILVTGFDIIFFWVARMMMMGLHFMDDVPFRKVYIHALVRDEKGQKMSKSKGNVIDPLDMIDKYGCDALRFALTALSTPGRDIKLAPARIEGYRNFATKIWNAARFCEMNGCAFDAAFDPAQGATLPVNQWLIAKVAKTVESLDQHYAATRFDLVAQTLYQFVWNDFCDWYLELSKPILQGEDGADKIQTQKMAAWAFAQILKMLHPVMPFITEELWQSMIAPGDMLMQQAWIAPPKAETVLAPQIDWLIALISEIRAVRSELNVPVAGFVSLQVKDADAATQANLKAYEATLKRLARVDAVTPVDTAPKNAAQIVMGQTAFFLPLAGIIDFAQERARLEKESAKLQQETAKLAQKLANDDFVSRAPPEVVDEQRQRLADGEAMLRKLDAARKAVAE